MCIRDRIGDADARVIAALSGRYHVVMDIPQSAYSQFDNSEEAKIVLVPGAQTQTIYLNCEKEALTDYRVRQALGWALDREELIALGMEGLSEPVTTWLGSNPTYEKVKNAYYDSCNVEKSAQLLDDAGWILDEDGFRYKDGPVSYTHLDVYKRQVCDWQSVLYRKRTYVPGKTG